MKERRVPSELRKLIAYAMFTGCTVFLFWRQEQGDNKREADRIERITSTCHQENRTLEQSRASKIQDARDLIDIFKKATEAQGRDWEASGGPQFAAGLIAKKEMTNKTSFPFRDCTNEGMRAFYEHPPPPVPCEPDGKGFCK